MAVTLALLLTQVFQQFRGDFSSRTSLAMLTSRSGLQMGSGATVTYNGARIGRVGAVNAVEVGGKMEAKLTLEIKPQYVGLIPKNVEATITTSTVFGEKHVALLAPQNPSPQPISSSDMIETRSVATEYDLRSRLSWTWPSKSTQAVTHSNWLLWMSSSRATRE